MDSNKAQMVAHLIRHAKLVDRFTDSDFARTLKERLKTAETCGTLQARFNQHLENAAYEYMRIQQSEPEPPFGPFPFEHHYGYYHRFPPSEPWYERRPNSDFAIAQVILGLAADLDCDWVEEGQKLLDAKRPMSQFDFKR